MTPDKPKIRTPEQKSRKMLKEENTIMNLELAVKKELFKMNKKTKPKLNFIYKRNSLGSQE